MILINEQNSSLDKCMKKKGNYNDNLNQCKLVYYLNAADFFILPTLAEGCCNAIIEAIACGLPVISSDLPFNRDILDESNSILVDPTDITSIQEAIVRLYENIDLRKQLSYGSIQKAKSLAKEWHAVTNVNEEKAIQYVKMHGISPELRKITPGNKIGKVRCRFSEEGVVFVIDKSKSSHISLLTAI